MIIILPILLTTCLSQRLAYNISLFRLVVGLNRLQFKQHIRFNWCVYYSLILNCCHCIWINDNNQYICQNINQYTVSIIVVWHMLYLPTRLKLSQPNITVKICNLCQHRCMKNIKHSSINSMQLILLFAELWQVYKCLSCLKNACMFWYSISWSMTNEFHVSC